MSDVAETVRDNQSVIQGTSATIAAMGLRQAGKRVAGIAVTPATWAVNHAVDGSTPSAVDVGIYLSAFVSIPASIVTGTMKAIVDDDMARRLRRVRAKEPAKYAKFIEPCYYYGMSAPAINAMTIANKGGTAWITSAGLWVYIKDAKGRLVADYEPREYVTLYRPTQPLKRKASGGFDWEVIRKR